MKDIINAMDRTGSRTKIFVSHRGNFVEEIGVPCFGKSNAMRLGA